MNIRKELIWGLVIGAFAGIIFIIQLFSDAKSAIVPPEKGKIGISISKDSIRVEIEKDAEFRTVTIANNRITRDSTGIVIDSELRIENGKIFIDGVELSEDQIDRLSIDRDERNFVGFEFGDKEHRRIKRKRLVTIYSDSKDDIFKFGDIIVDSNNNVLGDVVSLKGDIRISGRVSGDAVALFGDIYLLDDAYVGGDVYAPAGRIYKDEKAQIRGEIISSDKRMRIREKEKQQIQLGLSLRFNRVEGITLMEDLKYKDKAHNLPSLDLQGAYAFSLKRWEYDLGVSKDFGSKLGPYIAARMFQLAETPDSRLITGTENTIAGLIFKEDFYDFYWSRGLAADGGLYYQKNFRFGATYTAATISNLKRTANKAIFGGKKKFRENWSTILPDSNQIMSNDGKLAEVTIHASYDTRNDIEMPHSGIYANIDWRKTVKNDSSNFDYQVVSGEVQGYYPLTSNQNVSFRARAGYSNDNLPLFRQFFLGGIGSLRGYDYKEFEGNRVILLNAEYVWRFYRSDFGAGLFFDGGKAESSESQFNTGGLKTDVGISFLINDDIRLDIAQRLDDTSKHPVVSLRGHISF